MKRAFELVTRAGLIDRWHKQIGKRLQQHFEPRSLAVVKWSSRFQSTSSLIDIRNLRATVLYDDAPSAGEPQIRFAGYWAQAVEEGVVIGGSDGNRFDKRLSLAPRSGARNARIDASDMLLLRSALLLDARLSNAAIEVASRPRRLRIPTLWAGFEPAIADTVQGSGPELCGLCHRRGESSDENLKRFQHAHQGLVLFPFEWCGGYWQQVHAIFADFAGLPRCQILDCSSGFGELHGFRAACEFDFLSSRFASQRNSRTRRIAVSGAG